MSLRGSSWRRAAVQTAVIAALCLCLPALAASSASGSNGDPRTAGEPPLRIGKVSLAAPVAGRSAILIPVSLPLNQSNRVIQGRFRLRLPSGQVVTREWSDRPHAGGPRLADRRHSFRFVHAVPVSRMLTRQLFRFGTQVRVRSAVSVERLGSASGGRRLSVARAQVGLSRARPLLCSSAPLVLAHTDGGSVRRSLPRCGAPVRWSLAHPPSRGMARLAPAAGLMTLIPPQTAGPDRVVLRGHLGGRLVAMRTVQVRARAAGAADASIVAMGDSVTAGFGYFGETGAEMSITQLPWCKPGATVYNDACSSNSSNTTDEGSDPDYLPDYGLSRNISWAAQWANQYGITDYRNYAVSGSAPSDWLPDGQFSDTLSGIKSLNPDYIVMTMGANPLLSNMLFGLDNMGCALDADLFGNYSECIEKAFASVNLSENLNALYTDLVNSTSSQIVLMQYHLSIPSSALAYSATQIEMMGQMLNQVIAEQATAVSADRIKVVAPPRFFVGIDMSPLYPSSFSCSWLDYKVDGRSVQSTPTQDELLILHPLSFCSGPASGQPWIISGDTGIHPSATGYSRMASQLPAPQ